MTKRQHFTIIELLVVVGIISILAAMILPALKNAKEAARQVTCVSHLKQMGVGVHIYTDEYNRVLPPGAARIGGVDDVYEHLSAILLDQEDGSGGYIRVGWTGNTPSDIYCPSYENHLNTTTGHERRQTYLFAQTVNEDSPFKDNSSVSSVDTWAKWATDSRYGWRKLHRYASAETHMFMDATRMNKLSLSEDHAFSATFYETHAMHPGFRHGPSYGARRSIANVVFMDGRVESKSHHWFLGAADTDINLFMRNE